MSSQLIDHRYLYQVKSHDFSAHRLGSQFCIEVKSDFSLDVNRCLVNVNGNSSQYLDKD